MRAASSFGSYEWTLVAHGPDSSVSIFEDEAGPWRQAGFELSAAHPAEVRPRRHPYFRALRVPAWSMLLWRVLLAADKRVTYLHAPPPDFASRFAAHARRMREDRERLAAFWSACALLGDAAAVMAFLDSNP